MGKKTTTQKKVKIVTPRKKAPTRKYAEGEVINYYETMPAEYMVNLNYKNPYDWMIQHPARILIDGGTGSMKTNTAINIINNMHVDDLIIICGDPEEAFYRRIKDTHKNAIVSDDIEDLPFLDDLDKSKQHVVVFDDMVLADNKVQKKLGEYFIRGRKKNCTVIYITQSYFDVKPVIRKQCDSIILKQINSLGDLERICREYKGLGVSHEKLLEMYDICNEKQKDFFMILPTEKDINKRFRKNFTDAFEIK